MRAGGKFHYPFGNPDLTRESELKWRHKMALASLKVLMKNVERPTVFTPDELV